MDELSLSPLRGVFENKKAHLLEQMLSELAENEKADEDTITWELPSEERSSSRQRVHQKSRKRKRNPHDSPESRQSFSADVGSSSSLAPDSSSRDAFANLNADYAPLVLETPEEKMRERDRLGQEEVDPFDIVKSTPMAKLRNGARKRCSKRLSELVKLSEERSKEAERVKTERRRQHMNVELRSTANILTSPRKVRHVLLGASSSLFASPSNSTRILRVRSDLSLKFAEVNGINGSFANGHRTPNGSPLKSNGHLNGLNNSHSPGKSPAKSPRQQRLTELEPYGITYDRLKMYKQRMRDIEQAPIDASGELVLPWGSKRTSLLEENNIKVNGNGARKPIIQKNRSGRVVTQKSDTVYMAHTLLNVTNPKPLEDWKKNKRVTQTSPTKLHRLIRPACKASKRKLHKLRQQVKLRKTESNGDLASEAGSSSGSSTGSSYGNSTSNGFRSNNDNVNTVSLS
ncbi:hypothetical protein WR25_03694 [Diploscapter pachys]|uniref:Uncharacterized protein n=1 Tax=Diploscapter pachys TaxID=2018661 RepID=A0A2A2LPL8_9BILA|nr:hypothetical protein WR25_03694 [Diploscapter pachys]